jgi:hypothetical protein
VPVAEQLSSNSKVRRAERRARVGLASALLIGTAGLILLSYIRPDFRVCREALPEAGGVQQVCQPIGTDDIVPLVFLGALVFLLHPDLAEITLGSFALRKKVEELKSDVRVIAETAEQAATDATDEPTALFARMLTDALRSVGEDRGRSDSSIATLEEAAPRVQQLASAAERWVVDLEGRAGRDAAHAPSSSYYDLESPPRKIEIKAFASTARSLQMHRPPPNSDDRGFYVYVVENVATGDRDRLRLRVVPGADLLHASVASTRSGRTPVLTLRLTGYASLTAEEALAGPLRD